jgi:polyisoprenyl-phosphate glycosyltransferase
MQRCLELEGRPELSIVIPVFNEEKVLPVLWERVGGVLDASGISYEIVFIDDGSRDGSWSALNDLRGRDRRVRLVRLSRNFGQQAAITAGLDHARGQACIVMDADLQDPPELIPEMVARWREGFDVVYGVRKARRGESLFKRSSAALYYRLMRSATQVDLPVDSGEFRLLSRRALDAVLGMPESHRFVRGMVAWIGFRQTAVEFDRPVRAAGETKWTTRRMVHLALDGLLSFSISPLRMATMMGLFTAFCCLLYTAWAFYLRFAMGITVPGWTSTIVAVLFVGSVQLVCLGIIGEYVGRIYDEAKRRPLYLVDQLVEDTALADSTPVPRPVAGESRSVSGSARGR